MWLQWEGGACAEDAVETACLLEMMQINCGCPSIGQPGFQPSASTCGPTTDCGKGLGLISYQCEQKMNQPDDKGQANQLMMLKTMCGVAPASAPAASAPATSAGVTMSLPLAGVLAMLVAFCM